jgi:hypothetical protein
VAWIEGERASAADRLLAGIPARDLAGLVIVTDRILRHIDERRTAPSPE